MNSTQLLNHFDRLAEVPNAVPRLRRFVYDLAVRGRLVPQEPSDEPVSVLLDGRAARPKDEPWQIPAGWEWSTLGHLGEVMGGGTPNKGESEFWNGTIPWVSPKDMKVDWIHDAEDHISESAIARSSARLIPKKSLLMVVRGMILAHSFPTAISTVPLTINQDMKALVPFRPDLGSFLLAFTKGLKPEVMRLVKRSTHGTCKLLTDDLLSMPFPIPPLAEQRRIVAKLDELMALCDRLEAAQADQESRCDRLVRASLHRLNQAAGDQTLHDDVRFTIAQLPRLTTRPDHISKLRQALLNLAISGRLSSDAEWAKKAIRLGDVATLQNGYAFKSEWFTREGVRLLRNANVSHGLLDWTETVFLPEGRASDFERFALNEGDLVLSLDRPFISTGTKVARVLSQDLPCLLLQRVGRFKLQPELSPEFLLTWINSPQFAKQIDPGRSNGVPHISSKQVEAAEICLPPLAEQRLIVAKVDELMALCDRLESQLATVQNGSRQLLEALLQEALNGANK